MSIKNTALKNLPGCSLEQITPLGTPIICVLGCLLTDAGKAIKSEMITQLRKKYSIIAVNQEPPGKLFEYPAISFAQMVSITYKVPVLYIHTKGAAHAQNVYTQSACRKMWYDEFINHYDYYYDYIKQHDDHVVCPFTGGTKYTWINGFIAGTGAWSALNLRCTSDRYYYEYVFRDTKVVLHGRLMNNVTLYPSPETDAMINYIHQVNYEVL